MADPRHQQDQAATEAEELRTAGFRLREIQRPLSMRVEQENRRLDAESVEAIHEPGIDEEAARSGHEQD